MDKETFKVRHKLLQVIQKIAMYNQANFVKSLDTDEIWTDDAMFPRGNKLLTKFKVGQEISMRGYVMMA
eukprot:3836661-Ditylum_brightwellii.AAC.1